jgi:uncharacterized protein (DUF302 family)
MSYYICKVIDLEFDQAVDSIMESLKGQGFGILTDIDVRAKFKEELDLDFRRYRILGACDPKSAYKALKVEDKIGVLFPCNVIVQQTSTGQVEVAAMDPSAMMENIGNRGVSLIARDDRNRLAAAIDGM